MATITLAPEHALVGAVAMASGLLSLYLGGLVGSARRKYKVDYPTLYTTDETKAGFNCVQRGHQNYLENQPSFLCYLVVGSIYYPMVGAGLGALYLLSRISYASGYATGNPKNRQWGSYGYIGLIGLLGLSVHSLLKIGGLL